MRVVDQSFVKGHGTANDFVILPDLDGTLDLTAERTAWLCDRRRGIGADGVLRVARTANTAEVADFAVVAPYFMDYRNADGSLAEMCGNGVRVFARYLDAAGLTEESTFVVATRAGLVAVQVGSDEVSVDMGVVSGRPERIVVQHADQRWDAISVLAPNPHAVAFVPSLRDIGDLADPPAITPPFPDGVNVEFVERLEPGHVRMRVHERGVGETASCGTGACAVAWAAAQSEPDRTSWQVDVPGGTLWIDLDAQGRAQLRGPAILVARGTFQWPRNLQHG